MVHWDLDNYFTMASRTTTTTTGVRRTNSFRNNGGKGILQPKPKYQATAILNNKPGIISDKRDDDLVQERSFNTVTTEASNDSMVMNHVVDAAVAAIPDAYIDTIIEGFGEDADIFTDVLKAKHDAEPRQLRICYFRRGREILTEGGVPGLDGLAASGGDNVSELTKIRFQAVSMAYEIVSNPAWRAIYSERGLKAVCMKEDLKAIYSENNERPSVRWNEHVEELLFDLEPDEKTDPNLGKKKKGGKKAKAKIFIEQDEELDEHLAKLDAEAEPHFVTDFFDSLEESLDGLLKFGGKKSTGKAELPNSRDKNKSNNGPPSLTSDDRENVPIERVTSNDEDSLVGMLATRILGMSSASFEQPQHSNPEASFLVPLSHTEAKEPFRCVSPDPCRDDDVFDLENIAVSPISSVASGKQDTADANVEKEDDQGNAQAISVEDEDDDDDDDEDVFDGIEEEKPSSISMPRKRPISPANFSVTSLVSELSMSVANQSQTPGQFDMFEIKPDQSENKTPFDEESKDDIPDTPRISMEELFNDMPDEEFFEDTWCQPSQVVKALSFGEPEPEDGEEKTTTANEEQNDTPNALESVRPSNKDESFLQGVKSFVMAMSLDCTSMGKNMSEIDWKNAVLGAFMVEDEEVLQLMEIVSEEIQKAPALLPEDAVESPTRHVIEAAKSFS